MLYPFMTLDDETEIVHSEILKDGSVRVCVETPDEKDCFHHMTIYLPDYRISEVYNYTYEEFEKYFKIIRSSARMIMHFAAHGGFKNAPAI